MKNLKWLMAIGLLALSLAACDKKKTETPKTDKTVVKTDTPNTDTSEENILTDEEKAVLETKYAEDAVEEITEENADKVADELEKEIEGDE